MACFDGFSCVLDILTWKSMLVPALQRWNGWKNHKKIGNMTSRIDKRHSLQLCKLSVEDSSLKLT